MAYNVFHKKRELDVRVLQNINMLQLVMYAFSITVLIINQQKFFAEDFPLIFVACLIVKYPDLVSDACTKYMLFFYQNNI